MPVGYGEFSCCKLGHSFGGHTITCDKKRIRGTMEEMLQAKVASFKGVGKAAEKSWYACMQQFFLKGLPDKEVSFSPFTSMLKQCALRVLREAFGEQQRHSRQ